MNKNSFLYVGKYEINFVSWIKVNTKGDVYKCMFSMFVIELQTFSVFDEKKKCSSAFPLTFVVIEAFSIIV